MIFFKQLLNFGIKPLKFDILNSLCRASPGSNEKYYNHNECSEMNLNDSDFSDFGISDSLSQASAGPNRVGSNNSALHLLLLQPLNLQPQVMGGVLTVCRLTLQSCVRRASSQSKNTRQGASSKSTRKHSLHCCRCCCCTQRP